MKVKDIIRHLKHPPIPLKVKDIDFIKELKTKFTHNKRSFIHNKLKFYVDCLYCHAMPGTLEMSLIHLSKLKNDNNKLLNLGGGTGEVSSIISEIGFDVYNLDIEVENEDDKNKQFDLNDFAKLPYDNKFFDFVLCQEVIEHIENPWKLFRDMSTVMKNGAILVLTTPNIQSNYSKKVFQKSFEGHFNWFREKDNSFHLNPLPYWEIMLIAQKNGYELVGFSGNSNYYFNLKSKEEILKKSENLIFLFKKK